jgi:hypothetical protein
MRAPNQPVGKMSDTRIAWSSVTCSGMGTSVAAAYGIRAYSACRPLTGPVDCGPPKNDVPVSGPLGLATSHWA